MVYVEIEGSAIQTTTSSSKARSGRSRPSSTTGSFVVAQPLPAVIYDVDLEESLFVESEGLIVLWGRYKGFP